MRLRSSTVIEVLDRELRAVDGRAVDDVAAHGAVGDDEVLVKRREPLLEAGVGNLDAAGDGDGGEKLLVREAGLKVDLRDHRELDLDLDQGLIHALKLERRGGGEDVRGNLLAEERLVRLEHVLGGLARERDLVSARGLALELGHGALDGIGGAEVRENAFAGLHLEGFVVLERGEERLRQGVQIHGCAGPMEEWKGVAPFYGAPFGPPRPSQ